MASGWRTATCGTSEPSYRTAARWLWAPGQTNFLCSHLDLPTNLLKATTTSQSRLSIQPVLQRPLLSEQRLELPL